MIIMKFSVMRVTRHYCWGNIVVNVMTMKCLMIVTSEMSKASSIV